MADWEVDTGELAALASRVGAEASALSELAGEVARVLVEPDDFDTRTDVAGRYTHVVSTQVAGHVRVLADAVGTLVRDLSASAQVYDAVDEQAARHVRRSG